MPDKEQLMPDDFPLHTEQKKIVKPDGKDIAEASNPKIAEEVAERLNADEDRREQDRWA
jgi:hypothetical protein